MTANNHLPEPSFVMPFKLRDLTQEDYDRFRVKQARLERHMTQEQFGAALGITASLVTKIERGERNVSDQVMHDLRKLLTTDPAKAIGDSPSPDASPDSGEAIRFYKLPFTLHEPKGDGAAYIRDANGDAVAMLMWPGHSLEDTDAATEETYRIGRAMAAALPSPEAPANRQEVGEVEKLKALLKKERQRATDALYMRDAYRRMLGPKGQQVADAWDAAGLVRVHVSWGPDAALLDGEGIAQAHLDMAEAAKTGTPIEDVDGHIATLTSPKDVKGVLSDD